VHVCASNSRVAVADVADVDVDVEEAAVFLLTPHHH
jgi:hypothetical protein